MLVPSSFKFLGNGLEYELYVDEIYHGNPSSAGATLVSRESRGNCPPGQRNAGGTDFFTMGAAAGLLSAILFAIFERKSHAPDEGIALPPKRNH